MNDYTGPLQKHFTTSYHAVLGSKTSRFAKRSIWKYILASAILSLISPNTFGSFGTSFFILSAIFIAFGIIAILIGSQIWHKKIFMDADVKFSKDKIYISHRNKELIEEKDWNWIQSFKVHGDHVFIETSDQNSIPFILPKSSFEKVELDFLYRMTNKSEN